MARQLGRQITLEEILAQSVDAAGFRDFGKHVACFTDHAGKPIRGVGGEPQRDRAAIAVAIEDGALDAEHIEQGRQSLPRLGLQEIALPGGGKSERP